MLHTYNAIIIHCSPALHLKWSSAPFVCVLVWPKLLVWPNPPTRGSPWMARCHASGRAGHNTGCVSAPGAGLSGRAGCEERPARCASSDGRAGGSLSARAGMRRGCIYLSYLGMYRELAQTVLGGNHAVKHGWVHDAFSAVSRVKYLRTCRLLPP